MTIDLVAEVCGSLVSELVFLTGFASTSQEHKATYLAHINMKKLSELKLDEAEAIGYSIFSSPSSLTTSCLLQLHAESFRCWSVWFAVSLFCP